MKKFFFCVSLVLTGLMTSCIDKNEEVDADSKPSWLGGSIYAELKNPENNAKLSGTFNTYLRLVDDLGYDETLNRTGSKTVFPANDEAFERFFKSDNVFNVSSYEQLSDAQKKLLLYSSMLDNAMLLSMLPNVSNGSSEPLKGYAVKHASNISIIDTIQHITTAADMPKNNVYWKDFYDKGIYVVSDNTTPGIVHLTREYMLMNGITTLGDNSDFAIITGAPFTEGTAYIFNDRVISGDVTCQNGYIHQMEDVVVPPGNMAQVLRRKDNTKYFSRILDYFSVPVYDVNTTRRYNDWAVANNKPTIDSVYQVRFFSARSNESTATGDTPLNTDPNNQPVGSDKLLGFDPGWNSYYPKVSSNGSTGVDVSIMDIGAFFVPEDAAVESYFLPGGAGAYLMDIYGDKPNEKQYLMENLDSLYSKKPSVLADFTKNLMKASFTSSVPSKFPNVLNDASEVLGIDVNMLLNNAEGKKDIIFANNGVIYMIDQVIAPDKYQSVMAPATVYPDMQVMKWAVEDGVKTGDYLGVDFSYYLTAMKANYGFFIPEDAAFDLFYVDPASLGHTDPANPSDTRPDMLHFFYDGSKKPALQCERYYYNKETGMAEGTARPVALTTVKAQMVDILNFHTLVLDQGETIGDKHFYQTKNGGTLYVDTLAGYVVSGEQYEQNPLFPAPQIKETYNEKNGKAFRLDRIIQAPHQSVYSVLEKNSQFSDFLTACLGFESKSVLEWAGIPEANPVAGMPSPQDAYTIFTRDYKLGSTSIENACVDYNVKMFNTFNYTLFAPDNAAMAIAYANGLPKWTDILDLFYKYYPEDGSDPIGGDEAADKEEAFQMISAIRNFVRYHFMVNSVYADKVNDSNRYQTLNTDEMGVAKEIKLARSTDGTITVTDQNSHSVTITASDNSRIVNKMTRDYWLNAGKADATTIETSSFCAVHQISEPLYNNDSGSFAK